MGRLGTNQVLVTGGAGFIGSHLVDALLASGASVRVLDNFATGKRENLAHCYDQIELIEADVRDVAACRRACDGVQVVYHQAALGSVPRSIDDPATTLAVNVCGTVNLFAAARSAGVNRIVYASSSSVYGTADALPWSEGHEGDALSPYALSKQMDESLAKNFARCYGMTLVGLRYFNVFGARQDPNGPYAAVVPRFFSALGQGERPIIYGDGEQRRDFTYIEDVVRANLLAATAPIEGAVAVNVGAGANASVNDLCRAIRATIGKGPQPVHAPARSGEARASLADTELAARLLHFRARVDLSEGLSRIWQQIGPRRRCSPAAAFAAPATGKP